MGATFKCVGELLRKLLHVLLLAFSWPTNPSTRCVPQVAPFRIDTHAHYVPPFYRDLLERQDIKAGGYDVPGWSAADHIAVADAIGIKTSIVSVSTPGAKINASAPVEEGRLLARQLNEYGYNLTNEFPGRFKFFATLTLPDVEGAVAEAIYALDTLKASGVVLMANTFGEPLSGLTETPLFEVLNDRNATVFIHPGNSPCGGSTLSAYNSSVNSVPPYLMDFLLDTTRAAANLILHNVTMRFPNVNFILAHSGGFLPFASFRISLMLGGICGQDRQSIVQQFKRMYVDMALSATDTALPSTLAFFPTTQLVFGTDFPFASKSLATEIANYLDSYKTLGYSDNVEINHNNAAKLLNL